MPVTLVSGQIKRLDVEMVPVYVPPEPATLLGVVRDAVTGVGIAGVQISLEGGVGIYGGQTGTDGSYEIQGIEPGTYTVTFTHADYETFVK